MKPVIRLDCGCIVTKSRDDAHLTRLYQEHEKTCATFRQMREKKRKARKENADIRLAIREALNVEPPMMGGGDRGPPTFPGSRYSDGDSDRFPG